MSRSILENSMHRIARFTAQTWPMLVLAVLAVGLVAWSPSLASAQTGPGAQLGQQSMRPYAHVFWAYALAWAIVLGWVISIGRRWSRVEREIGAEAPDR